MLTVGDLTLDENSREVRRAGEEIHLTTTEFELLRYFMRNPKRVLSKARSLTECGITISEVKPMSSSCTSLTCARRSTGDTNR
ncbi:two-component system response regulator [Cutibacterium acnes JCM 18918]|nr:two-component system response regulator [Cutibacterium acnes JCM 18918]